MFDHVAATVSPICDACAKGETKWFGETAHHLPHVLSMSTEWIPEERRRERKDEKGSLAIT